MSIVITITASSVTAAACMWGALRRPTSNRSSKATAVCPEGNKPFWNNGNGSTEPGRSCASGVSTVSAARSRYISETNDTYSGTCPGRCLINHTPSMRRSAPRVTSVR